MNRSIVDTALEIRRDYGQLGSWEAVGQKHGKPGHVVQKLWYNAKTRHKLPDPLAEALPAEPARIIEFPHQNFDEAVQAHRQQIEAELASDIDKFQAALDKLQYPIRLAWLTDIHFPFHDEYALELALEITRHFDPHLCPVMSDYSDFPNISFWKQKDVVTDDDWIATEPYHVAFGKSLVDATPNAIRESLPGNHDQRWWQYFVDNAPAARYTATREMIQMVRHHYGAFWNGYQTSEYRIGGLHLRHGHEEATKMLPQYVAKQQGDRRAWRRTLLFGHYHRYQVFTKTFEHERTNQPHTVESVSSPCLCQLVAHYRNGTTAQDWQQGVVMATIYEDAVDIQPVIFKNYTASFGDKIFRVRRWK